MRINQLNIHLKHSPNETYPPSQLRILIRIAESPDHRLPLPPRKRQECLLLPIAPHITPPARPPNQNIQAAILPHIPNPRARRTIGVRLPTLKREDAFRIELLSGNLVSHPTAIFPTPSKQYTNHEIRRQSQRNKRTSRSRSLRPSTRRSLLPHTRSLRPRT